MIKISNQITPSSLTRAALPLVVMSFILPTTALAQTEEVKNEPKTERRIGFYLGSAFRQIPALWNLSRDKKITRKTAQEHLKAYRLSHKNERDDDGIRLREASELAVGYGIDRIKIDFKCRRLYRSRNAS